MLLADCISSPISRGRKFWSPRTANAPGQSSYSAATLAGGSTCNIAAIPAGSRKAFLKKFENVSEFKAKIPLWLAKGET
jgi:hypothetical protein